MEQLSNIVIFAIPIIVAITLHEAAHGFVALHFGDDTAAKLGRVTLNPLKHVDPVGTILLPALLLLTRAGFVFGYAKPVPVNFAGRDMIWVAGAGPAMNVLLALVSLAILFLLSHSGAAAWLHALFASSVQINLVLAVLNILPIPPLDGSKVALGLLPAKLAVPFWRLSRYGFLFILVIFFVAPFVGIDVFGFLIARPVNFLERPFAALLGPP